MRFQFMGAAASLLIGVFTAGTAHAQWPCPGGPGPGEVQIGVTGGSHGIAATPLCADNGAVSSDDFDDGGSYDGGYSAPLPDIFMVVVTHYDTGAIWTSTGYPSEDAATRAAMDGCTRTMGAGCAVAWYGRNDYAIAAVQDAAGLLFIEGDLSASGAKAKAMATCSTASAACRHVRVVQNSNQPSDNFPRGRPPVYRYAVIAWPKTMPAQEWQGKVWLAGGVEGFDRAAADAEARCKADTGLECVRGQHSANGVLVRFVDDVGRVYWIGSPRADTASAGVARACPAGRQCRIVDVLKAADPATGTLTGLKSDRPLRGFYAVYWSSTPSDVRPLAIVTGEPTREAADKAARAFCEKQSKGACQAFIAEADWGTEQFIKVLSDAKRVTRIEFGYSPEDVAAKMEASCRKDGVACTGGRLIDVAKRASLYVAP